MQHPVRILALCVATLTATACGDEASPTTDKDSARTGWISTEKALGEVGLGLTAMGSVNEDGVMGSVTGTAECPDGGSVSVEAEGAVDDSMTSGSLAIDFDGCQVDGVTIDGSLEYRGKVTEAEVTASIHGDLTWSGAATGDCAIDIEASVSNDGSTASGSAVNGGMCGYDFADVLGG